MKKLLKTTLTKQDMQKLVEATKQTIGTIDYTKYTLEYYCKFCSNTYKFLTWSRFNQVPLNTEFIVKTFKGKVYLYTYTDERYTLTNEINQLLSIWEEV